jgi:hypothetical protein
MTTRTPSRTDIHRFLAKEQDEARTNVPHPSP